jgi:hypothetical protein
MGRFGAIYTIVAKIRLKIIIIFQHIFEKRKKETVTVPAVVPNVNSIV